MTTLCRCCATPLDAVLDLGRQPVSQARLTPGETADEGFYHLQVAACPSCHLVQLLDTPPPEAMFVAEYPYVTGTSAVMAAHFRAAATTLSRRFVPPGGRVVEIGCNDGSFLRHVPQPHLGVEPAGGVAALARAAGVEVVEAFFGEVLARDLRQDFGAAHLIFAANVAAHIPDVAGLARAVASLLHQEGAFVFEVAYLGDILAHNSFDQFYDEHVFTWSALAVQAVFARAGLELFDLEHLPVHGGSMRFHLCHEGRHPVSAAVADTLAAEGDTGLGRPDCLTGLAAAARRVKDELPPLLARLASRGAAVAGYGATAKSTTLLNYCGLGARDLAFIADSTPAKIGKVSPGGHVPIVSPEEFRRLRPDYALLFAWNHRAEIEGKETEWRSRGGKWILYTPRVEVA